MQRNKQSEDKNSTDCNSEYYHKIYQDNESTRSYSPYFMNVDNEILELFPPKLIYLFFEQKSSTPACIRPLSWQLLGKLCCLPLRHSFIRQEYFQLGHKSFTLIPASVFPSLRSDWVCAWPSSTNSTTIGQIIFICKAYSLLNEISVSTVLLAKLY